MRRNNSAHLLQDTGKMSIALNAVCAQPLNGAAAVWHYSCCSQKIAGVGAVRLYDQVARFVAARRAGANLTAFYSYLPPVFISFYMSAKLLHHLRRHLDIRQGDDRTFKSKLDALCQQRPDHHNSADKLAGHRTAHIQLTPADVTRFNAQRRKTLLA